ncbi:MAG TPA: tRNA (adenosine(37)-N6)-dimethylallyltransferase MiaA [Cytophagales bacterium]|nr:tRNA (adenosine(37)-N6)-dimethylallyltransferase MiaA [Cytophagales bacterium]
MEAYDIIVVLGPTASGKTALAVDLAQVLDAEIISADSRQVYKNMNIGTGKDLQEYQGVPYHIIDICAPGTRYDVAQFQRDFWKAYTQIRQSGKKVILCGGTGLYIDAVLHNYQHLQVPENETLRQELQLLSDVSLQQLALGKILPENADLSTRKRTIRAIEVAIYMETHKLRFVARPILRPFVIGLDPPLEIRRTNIIERLDKRLKGGLIEEVKFLLQNGVSSDMLHYYGLEYKFVMQYLDGIYDRSTLQEKLGIAIQQYAKRQMTYFRSMERKGTIIHWINF